MIHNGNSIGAITIARREAGAFSATQIGLLQTFAEQAVIAIENARSFNETKEALERQTATAEILKVIASSPSDVQPVLDVIVRSAARLIGGFSALATRFAGDMIHLAAFTATNKAGDKTLRSQYPGRSRSRPSMQRQSATTVSVLHLRYRTSSCSAGVREKRWDGRGAIERDKRADAPRWRDPGNDRRLSPRSQALQRSPDRVARDLADQAVIAIENARSFNETKEALERQTATARS
jgi:hypothetical protein